MTHDEIPPSSSSPPATTRRASIFFIASITLILLAVLRSSLATRLDGFTLDEPYHITAGVSYVRTGDYRLNPEHPPLVKLWVGAVLSRSVFHLSEFQPLRDKSDERRFADAAVFLRNDPDRVQGRARLAMLSLNAVLLLCFALAARRALGSIAAAGALAFLAMDPTVAAHLPVVMTDLPVALLSATAFLGAIAAFETWRLRDLLRAAAFLGLALAAKHSGLIPLGAVAALGVAQANLRLSRQQAHGSAHDTRVRKNAKVAAVLLGALLVLWGFYRFRFDESPHGRDVFNRPLALKIADLHSPAARAALETTARAHLLPRAYIWGLADTWRAGIEGRVESLYAFGRRYDDRAPFYFFPGVLMVKLPLGLIALAAAGLFLWVKRKVEPNCRLPLAVTAMLAAAFLVTLAFGQPYGGIRHALPVVALVALFGGVALRQAIQTRSRAFRAFAAVAAVAALASALPVMRPWEYYSELIGGTASGWRYFNDEGVDLGQRGRELVRYYHERLRLAGEVPYIFYPVSREELQRRGVHWVGEHPADDDALTDASVVSGTFLVGATHLAPAAFWDFAGLRATLPATRFGNLFVYRGTLPAAWVKGPKLFFRALDLLNATPPDEGRAEELLVKSVESDPTAFFVAIELGNLRAQRGAREPAIQAYETARAHAPPGSNIADLLTQQIERISKEPPQSVPPLRNPFFE